MEYIVVEKTAVEDLGVEFEKNLIIKNVNHDSVLRKHFSNIIGKQLMTINKKEVTNLTDIIASTLGVEEVEIGIRRNELNHIKYTQPLGNQMPVLTRPSDYMDVGELTTVSPPPPPPSPQPSVILVSSDIDKANSVLSLLDNRIRDASSTDEFLANVSERINVARKLQKPFKQSPQPAAPVSKQLLRSPHITDLCGTLESSIHKFESLAGVQAEEYNIQPLRVVTNTVSNPVIKKPQKVNREEAVCVDRVAQTSKGLWCSLPKTVAERNQTLGLWKPKPQLKGPNWRHP